MIFLCDHSEGIISSSLVKGDFEILDKIRPLSKLLNQYISRKKSWQSQCMYVHFMLFLVEIRFKIKLFILVRSIVIIKTETLKKLLTLLVTHNYIDTNLKNKKSLTQTSDELI